jgi:YfiH family protein
MGQADGLITCDSNIYLFMRFGDCTPLIFFDPVQNAVGLTHAGWRGTMKNAAGATVKAMVNQLGCRPRNILAVIGPAIGPCCYEVGQDVITAAAESLASSDSLFVRRNGSADHAHFDMWEANRQQLLSAGVEQVVQTGLCTACRTNEFFSHRAEKGKTGRFGVIIGIREAAR